MIIVTDTLYIIGGKTMKISTKLRRYAGYTPGDNFPFIMILPDSYEPPKKAGESFYHTTPSGRTIVRYPRAYGYPTLYHNSTRRVEVGEHWIRLYMNIDPQIYFPRGYYDKN